MTIETKIGTLKVATPLLLGSGYITEDNKFYRRSVGRGCSGIVTRSLKLNVPTERLRIPAPRYVLLDNSTMLNCEWGNEQTWETWKHSKVAEAKNIGGLLIISLSGRDVEGCCSLISEFDSMEPDAYEINISCAHSGELHGNLNLNLEHLEKVMRTVRPLTEKPIWIKLSMSSILLQMAQVAETHGADAIVCTNSIGPGLLLDTRTGKPFLGIQGGAGGLTGSAIFPLALQCVYKLKQVLSIPIVGVGGINTADHVVQMMMAGASAVQLYTEPALRGPRVFEKIANGLRGYVETSNQFRCLEQLIGFSHVHEEVHAFSAPPPIVIAENCTGCLECAPACAFNAISFEGEKDSKIVVINENCNGCNACVGVCPPEYDALRITTR